MFTCDWIEGTRTYDVCFGAITSTVCLYAAIPTLWWGVAKRRVWLFSEKIDRNQGLQLAYGIFAMAMAWTDALCRFIPHKPLAWVHPAFFLTTLIIAIGLGPRVTALMIRERQNSSHVRSARSFR